MASLLVISFMATFLIFIYAPVAMSQQEGSGGINNLVEEICRQMEDYGFCRSVIYQNISPTTSTISDLAKVTIQQAITNATNTDDFIKGLLAKETDPTMKNYLTICQNSYNIVSKSFEQAFQAFGKNDYKGMLQYETTTPKAAASCVTIFKTPPTRLSPLNERNREMRILIAMAIVTGYNIAGVQG